jgi:hypothetical protein
VVTRLALVAGKSFALRTGIQRPSLGIAVFFVKLVLANDTHSLFPSESFRGQ